MWLWQSVTAVLFRATLGEWLLVSSGLLLILYIAGTWNYDYFQKRGVPSSRPKVPFLGDLATVFLGRRSFYDIIKDQYKQGESSGVFGMFEFTKPFFLVRDPEILKVVTVKDFDKFTNHRNINTENTDPIFNKNLFNLGDESWRNMRATLSPAFTSSKMKGMFPLISQCGDQMVQHLRQKYSKSEEGKKKEPLATDMKDIFARMANDVIASVVFGVSCDSLKNQQNEFYQMGKVLTKFNTIRFFGFVMFPKLMQILGLRMLDSKATKYFGSLVQEMIRERKKKNIFRPDVLQLLMQARDGNIHEDKEDVAEAENIGTKKKLTDDDIVSQTGVFFFAGFETVSTAVCLASCLLAHHEDVQMRLQAEITEGLSRSGGKPTYDVIQGMKYLDAVINETLRMYPPTMATDRQCREETMLPSGTNSEAVTVHKGQMISISITGMHHDPQFWEEPQKFDPERFSDENKHNIKPFTYMPFGLGPRTCIGQRLALIEVKLALIHLLSNFDLHPCAKTKHPLEFEPGLNVMARGGFWCGLKPRQEPE